jgi:hypothetical protein
LLSKFAGSPTASEVVQDEDMALAEDLEGADANTDD